MAMKHSSKKVSIPAKAMRGTVDYADRFLGISARKVRNQGEILRRATKTVKDNHLNRLSSKVNHLGKNLTSASTTTRIKTGLAIGAAAMAHRALKNKQQEYQDQQLYY